MMINLAIWTTVSGFSRQETFELLCLIDF